MLVRLVLFIVFTPLPAFLILRETQRSFVKYRRWLSINSIYTPAYKYKTGAYMCFKKPRGYIMEHETSTAKWSRKGKKDHALMHKIWLIEHDRTRRRPVNENRFEVWLQQRIWGAFFPFWSQSGLHWKTDYSLKYSEYMTQC